MHFACCNLSALMSQFFVRRIFTISGNIISDDDAVIDAEHNECVRYYCSIPDAGHRVYVIQPGTSIFGHLL